MCSNGKPITELDMFVYSFQLGTDCNDEDTHTWDWDDKYINPIPAGNEEIPYYEDASDEEDSDNDKEGTTDEESECEEEIEIGANGHTNRNTENARRLNNFNGDLNGSLIRNLELIKMWNDKVEHQRNVDASEPNKDNIPEESHISVRNFLSHPNESISRLSAPCTHKNPLGCIPEQLESVRANEVTMDKHAHDRVNRMSHMEEAQSELNH